jgi:YVTN family beta-propeller protein
LLLVTAAAGAQTTVPSNGRPWPAPEIETLATTSPDGEFARVDLVDGGIPVADPGGASAPNPAKRAFYRRLTSFSLDGQSGSFGSHGWDLDGDLTDTDGDGVPDSGFDSYLVGLAPRSEPARERRIIGANNLYDLFQTTHGPPDEAALQAGFTGFDGGDADGDGDADGGPGLFSNGLASSYPTLPPLPHVMGEGRGGEPGEQHQFLQVVFPYALDHGALFDLAAPGNSFLDSEAVTLEARWVELGADGVSVIDRTDLHRQVSGVAIIGGVCALPTHSGATTFALVDPADPALSAIPVGAHARVYDARVLTFIPHEDPAGLPSNPVGSPMGWIDDAGVLHLPDPTARGLPGGRVFGANPAVPDAVNDFSEAGDALAAPIGFVSFTIHRLRTAAGRSIPDAWFHTFEVSQDGVGSDPRAAGGSFTRGPAIAVDEATGLPAIEVLGGAGGSDPGDGLAVDAVFRVTFDKEVVPNSVGFSRRHSVHSTADLGVVLPFHGNVRASDGPAPLLVPGALSAPVAPSLFLAVNQAAQVAVNNPVQKAGTLFLDDGVTPIDPDAVTVDQQNALQGLHPTGANDLATLPRAVVPCDVYPVNQNNLQAYILEPLVPLPPGAVVTLGVCRAGLGTTGLGLTNHGNFTVSGTRFTATQSLSPVGLGEDGAAKTSLIANELIIKLNAGPMDLSGRLFEGSTAVALDTLIDGDPGNDLTTGGTNVARTWQVDPAGDLAYVNAPVAPEALVAAFAGGGAGVLDLNGRGLTTNAPGGALANPEMPQQLVVSRYLDKTATGLPTLFNWANGGSFANGNHTRAFGIVSRYATGCGGICQGGASIESELAIGEPVPTGPLTPRPGVNEGSSGPGTFVRDSQGQFVLTAGDVGQIQDVVVGDFLDARWSDVENPWASVVLHRSINAPTVGVLNNSIADPPVPNPPPLGFPVGVPHTAVRFDQDDLLAPPVLIEGVEVFTRDTFMGLEDLSGDLVGVTAPNALIHLNVTGNPSNPYPSSDISAAVQPPLGPSPFPEDMGLSVKFSQSGPAMKWDTSAATLLSSHAQFNPGTASVGGIKAPVYTSRQQIGNLLFVTDRTHGVVHALNSNTMAVLGSLDLPDPYGLGLSPDLEWLYVSNRGDDSLSVVDADLRSAGFLTEVARVPVGDGPTAVAAAPDGEDVFVVNTDGDSISILDAATRTVRKTLSSPALDEPTDICLGMREVSLMPGFQSGVYHGYIANTGGDNVLIYQSGPSGVAGLGFDDIIGEVTSDGSGPFAAMVRPTRVVFDPVAPLDAFANTVGCFVLHQDDAGQAVVSRVSYTHDSFPGVTIVNTTTQAPSFGDKVFQIVQQYATGLAGEGLALALPDFDRQAMLFGACFGGVCGFNAGGHPPYNGKTPMAFPDGGDPVTRWDPSELHVSVAGHGLCVFDLPSGLPLDLISTPGDVGVLASYYGQ